MKAAKFISKAIITALLTVTAGLFAAVPAFADAQVLTVGPGQMYETPAAAFAVAQPGDTIEVYADGNYYGADYYLAITKPDITIRGVAANGIARPHFIADPVRRLTYGKAIWLVNANNVTIENIEFSGATLPADSVDPVTGSKIYGSKNGRGIGVDNGANVTIRNCYIHNCDNAILTNNTTNITNLTFEGCEFGDNGFGDGYSHNLYIGKIGTLNFRYNYSRNCDLGHLLKTRAKVNYIEYNRLTEEGPGRLGMYANSNIDLSNAGYAYVIGNIFHQPNVVDSNKRMISYGVEGPGNPGWTLNLINNTFVNEVEEMESNYFVQLHNAVTANVKNNIFTGSGTIIGNYNGSLTEQLIDSSNLINTNPGYVNMAAYDYRLSGFNAAAVDKGVDPGVSPEGYSLVPVRQYVDKAASEDRPVYGALDIGAYEYGIAAGLTVNPNVINLKKDEGNGMVTVSVVFPAGITFESMDLDTVRMNGQASPIAEETLGYVKNAVPVMNDNGQLEYTMKFRRDDIAPVLLAAEGNMVVSGSTDAFAFTSALKVKILN